MTDQQGYRPGAGNGEASAQPPAPPPLPAAPPVNEQPGGGWVADEPRVPTAGYAYSYADPAPNWGLAQPAAPGYAVLVPRPPRPTVVRMAVLLAYAGAALSGVQTLLTYLYQWSHRRELLDAATANAPGGAPNMESMLNTSLVAGIVIGSVVWLLAAAGTVVCAALAGRGRNPARIVLACLAGLFALSNLCGSVAGLLLSGARAADALPTTSFGAQLPWWSLTLQAVLGLMAVALLVLVLLPAANRYFSPGPGRRFAPGR
jgi:hypothetical protein